MGAEASTVMQVDKAVEKSGKAQKRKEAKAEKEQPVLKRCACRLTRACPSSRLCKTSILMIAGSAPCQYAAHSAGVGLAVDGPLDVPSCT